MIKYPEFVCNKCKKNFFDEESAGAEDGFCGNCRNKTECEECGRWVDKVNRKKLCIGCIPRYIKYPSVMAAIDGETIGDYYIGKPAEDKIEILAGIVDCILDNFPKDVADKVLKYRKLDYRGIKDRVFIQEEDKIE